MHLQSFNNFFPGLIDVEVLCFLALHLMGCGFVGS